MWKQRRGITGGRVHGFLSLTCVWICMFIEAPWKLEKFLKAPQSNFLFELNFVSLDSSRKRKEKFTRNKSFVRDNLMDTKTAIFYFRVNTLLCIISNHSVCGSPIWTHLFDEAVVWGDIQCTAVVNKEWSQNLLGFISVPLINVILEGHPF